MPILKKGKISRSWSEQHKKIFWFSLSTTKGQFCFGSPILKQTLPKALLGFTAMITIDKKSFQDYQKFGMYTELVDIQTVYLWARKSKLFFFLLLLLLH